MENGLATIKQEIPTTRRIAIEAGWTKKVAPNIRRFSLARLKDSGTGFTAWRSLSKHSFVLFIQSAVCQSDLTPYQNIGTAPTFTCVIIPVGAAVSKGVHDVRTARAPRKRHHLRHLLDDGNETTISTATRQCLPKPWNKLSLAAPRNIILGVPCNAEPSFRWTRRGRSR